jgi:Coenzyme PQQ synthesis protein D (PqqD)
VIVMKKYKLKESIIYQEVGEEALLLDGKTEEVFSLNAVARDIWLAVQRTNSLDAAMAEMMRLYKVDASILRRDALALLKSIREAGLLE